MAIQRPIRFCVWGGRRGDIWIGSPEDQRITRLRQLAALRFRREIDRLRRNVTTLGEAMGKALLPSMNEVAKVLRQLGASVPEQRTTG
jgi:hypothetical protein